MMYLGNIKIKKAYLGDIELTSTNAFIGTKSIIPDANLGKIEYTTITGTKAIPNKSDGWGAEIVSNVYSKGKGTITFNGHVTNIPTDAFKGNSDINSITLPNTVRNINKQAFNDMTSLSYVSFNGSYVKWNSVIKDKAWLDGSNISFVRTNNGDTMLYMDRVCYTTIDDEPTTPHNTYGYKIKSHTHNGKYGTIVFDKTFWVVGSTPASFFLDNYALESCILPSYMGRVHNAIFKGCTNLKRVTLPRNILYMENSLFSGCYNLNELYYLGTKEDWEVLVYNSKNWNFRSFIETVHCLDGDVEVTGSESEKMCVCR